MATCNDNAGFILSVNENQHYHDICKVAVQSLVLFSHRPIEVVTYNSDFHHDFGDRIVTRRIDIPLRTINEIWFSKELAVITTAMEEGLYLDVDTISTPDVEKFFRYLPRVNEYPVCALHPCNPWGILSEYIAKEELPQPYDRWVSMAAFLFKRSCMPFLRELWSTGMNAEQAGDCPQYGDESLANLLLLRKRARTNWIGNCLIPHEWYAHVAINKTIAKPVDMMPWVAHGSKDVIEAQTLLAGIRTLYGK